MVFDLIEIVIPIVLLLSIILVGLSAFVIHKSNKRFTEGEIKSLGSWVFLAMLALLLKLVFDVVIQIIPLFFGRMPSLIQLLEIFSIFFIILIAVFMIKIALLIQDISKIFGFK